jgi:hypothetical protein
MKKEIRRMTIEPAENGGHTVSHEYAPSQREGRHGMIASYVEPEKHVFGANEGHAMLAHVANHLNIPESEEGQKEEDGETPEMEAKSHPASFLKAALKDKEKGRLSEESAKRVREAVK